MAQIELNYNNINLDREGVNSNKLSLIFSGIYGLNLGLNTDFLFSCYLSLPLNKEKKLLRENSFYHSPFTIKETFLPYSAMMYDLTRTGQYDFITGAKIMAFYNLSNTVGISGTSHFSLGKIENKKNDYTFNTQIRLRYNILSKLVLYSDFVFFKTQNVKASFHSAIQISYIIF